MDRGWWRTWTSARVAVGLTFVVAFLSTVTGVANIFPTTTDFGPLVPYLPESIRDAAGFTGALTGFLLMTSAYSLRKGYRAAWYSTVFLLPVAAVQGLVQSNEVSLPLIGLSAVTLVAVGWNRRRFDRRLELTATQLAALLAIVGALLYGTMGTYALRDEFSGVDGFVDALYFTLVTASTVGYGDITPATPTGRLFGITVLLVTVSSFAVALGVLLTPAIEARLAKTLGRMTESQLDLLEDHILVLGYGDLTEPILEELDGRASFVILTPDAEWASLLSDRGFDVLTADPSDEASLERANIAEARAVVVATNQDAEDALSILTARQLNPRVRIVAAATHRENAEKLKRAGADAVISPASIGGHMLVESALGDDETESLAERLLSETPAETVASDESADRADAASGASETSSERGSPDDADPAERATSDRDSDRDTP